MISSLNVIVSNFLGLRSETQRDCPWGYCQWIPRRPMGVECHYPWVWLIEETPTPPLLSVDSHPLASPVILQLIHQHPSLFFLSLCCDITHPSHIPILLSPLLFFFAFFCFHPPPLIFLDDHILFIPAHDTAYPLGYHPLLVRMTPLFLILIPPPSHSQMFRLVVIKLCWYQSGIKYKLYYLDCQYYLKTLLIVNL